MIRYKALTTLCIASLLQGNAAQSQLYGSYSNYGSYYVPYSQESTSGPIRYVPVQELPPGNNALTNLVQATAPSYLDQYPQNGPYPSYGSYPPTWPNPSNGLFSPIGPYPPNDLFHSPIYSNSPTVSYQGLDEANALRSAYPNQPIIIINNGGNGDTGGNSNNGNNNGKGTSGLNFGDLAALFLATKHRGKGRIEGPISPDGPAGDLSLPPVAPTQGINAGFNNEFRSNAGATGCGGNNKCRTVTHITIILPSLGGSVTVEDKKKKNKADRKHKKKYEVKEEEEEEDEEEEDHDDDKEKWKKEAEKDKKIKEKNNDDNE